MTTDTSGAPAAPDVGPMFGFAGFGPRYLCGGILHRADFASPSMTATGDGKQTWPPGDVAQHHKSARTPRSFSHMLRMASQQPEGNGEGEEEGPGTRRNPGTAPLQLPDNASSHRSRWRHPLAVLTYAPAPGPRSLASLVYIEPEPRISGPWSTSHTGTWSTPTTAHVSIFHLEHPQRGTSPT